MVEQIINRRNMHLAYLQVMRNKGSAGVDSMQLKALKPYIYEHRESIAMSIISGTYLPQPIPGVSIPKGGGKTRLLGIPTVVERWLQQSVAQVITPLFEYEFSRHSYGFRPGKSAHDCILQAQKYIHEGYGHIVDIDLKSFFDEVDHCLLLQLLYRKVKCPLTLRLIRKWLRVPIQIDGKLTKRRKGVPQGSPLSPLLSNIMLHEPDKEQERRGLKFVRYADDFSIYTNSKDEAEETGKIIDLFLKNKLKLVVNEEKSGIRRPTQFKILGYRFVSAYGKDRKGKYQLAVSDKSWDKLKEKLKAITRKTAPMSIAVRITKLKEAGRGWLNYFRMANIQRKLKDMDGWLRNRLRHCIWHNRKKPEQRRKNLMRLGVDYAHAYAWSRTRMGGWAVAQSPIMVTTITLDRLGKRGYEALLEYYFKVAPAFNEPLYTRPVRTMV